ncbi:hypothetical protein TNCV_3811661 [Trichonephila clavipes]|nr:hypothetical protein TNCV_3811661 [Trichonephila clavipes]
MMCLRDIAASCFLQMSAYENATQTELLSSVKIPVPIHCVFFFSNSGCSRHQRTPPMGKAKVHTVQGVVQQTTTVQSSGHGKTRYRSSARFVCQRFLPPVACFFWPCKTMYLVICGVVPRGRPLLNPRIAVPVV